MTAIPPGPAARVRGPNPITEFFIGMSTLLRGFGFWRRRPGAMALGLIPAAIVFAILVVLIVLLVATLDPLTIYLTGFAENWDESWRNLLRIGFGLALIVGLVVLFAFSFTALTLLIGDWFYQRIWQAVEADLGEFTPGAEPGFWRSVGDGVLLLLRALFTGLLIVLLGLVPLIGTVLAVVVGTFLSGRLVALELTTRPLEARGMTRPHRRAALHPHRARVLGFGVAVHLSFLIPGGAIIVMPAAVAGATVLAKHVLGEPTRSEPGSIAEPR
jgi:CysZ protein